MVFLGIIFSLFARGWDRDRIAQYLTSRRCELLECEPKYFARGWRTEKNERMYTVSYRDSEGDIHTAECKTGMFTGVFFTNDFVVESTKTQSGSQAPQTISTPAPDPQELAELQQENARLKSEILQLQKELESYKGPLMG